MTPIASWFDFSRKFSAGRFLSFLKTFAPPPNANRNLYDLRYSPIPMAQGAVFLLLFSELSTYCRALKESSSTSSFPASPTRRDYGRIPKGPYRSCLRHRFLPSDLDSRRRRFLACGRLSPQSYAIKPVSLFYQLPLYEWSLLPWSSVNSCASPPLSPCNRLPAPFLL